MSKQPITSTSHIPPGGADFQLRFAQLQASWSEGALADADARFLALRDEFERIAQPLRRALLGSPFEWGAEENRQARWLHSRCDDFATLGYELSDGALKQLCATDERARAVMATTLFFMAETVKWDISISAKAPHDMRKLHGLMRIAMACGRHCLPMQMHFDGREVSCTLESLYFRVLLLARFASGALSGKQIEIIDAWMWLWTPMLSGVSSPPPGSALRADLDSATGLQRGPREDDGPSLYLPQAPIEEAYRSIVAEFHAGRMVPSEGLASEFHVEEHVAVLDLIRHGLKLSRREPVARAARNRVERPVAIHLGLAEILKCGFAPPAPIAAAVTLAAVDRSGTHMTRRMTDGEIVHGIFDADRRQVQLIDESATGLGLEGSSAEFGATAVGDLLAVRLSGNEPLVLAKVVRCVPSKSIGRVFVGLRRVSAASQPLQVRRELADRTEQLETLFVPGEETNGRFDACIVSERVFMERAPFVATIDDGEFKLRLNRVRERGRGWVLAGFEVVSARSAMEIA